MSDDGYKRFLPTATPKKDMRSDLIKAKAVAGGLVVNACPFGCEEHELDAEGYCKHLVGFTLPGSRTQFEPLKSRFDSNGKPTEHKYLDGKDLQTVMAEDVVEPVTVSARVYRRTQEQAEAEAASQAKIEAMLGKNKKKQTEAV